MCLSTCTHRPHRKAPTYLHSAIEGVPPHERRVGDVGRLLRRPVQPRHIDCHQNTRGDGPADGGVHAQGGRAVEPYREDAGQAEVAEKQRRRLRRAGRRWVAWRGVDWWCVWQLVGRGRPRWLRGWWQQRWEWRGNRGRGWVQGPVDLADDVAAEDPAVGDDGAGWWWLGGRRQVLDLERQLVQC